jgi:hypothetical protein
VRVPAVAAVKTGAATFVALRSVAGVQLYVFAPLAVSVCVSPTHKVSGPTGVIETVGFAFTVTVTVAEFVQPVAVVVPVTV